MLMTALVAIISVVGQAGGWSGDYRYEESLGRDGAGQGNSASITHHLRLDGKSGCRLMAHGYQANTDIRCTSKPVKDGIEIAFKSYADGSTRNQYGVERYKIGAPLFTLRGKGPAITTEWQAYKPDTAKGAGRYFAKH